MSTHYISASSNPDIRGEVEDLAFALGSDWCLDHDWTECFDEPVANPSILAHLDLECAVRADIFIFLDSEYFSRGGMMEYGARLAAGKPVLHVGCLDLGYLFFQHQLVTHFESPTALLSYLANR